LSSHLLYQVQAVCDRVGLFHHGQMVLEGTVPELARRVLGKAYRIYLEADGPTDRLNQTLHSLPGAVSVKQLDRHAFEVEAESDLRAQAAKAVIEAGGMLLKLDVEAQSLDDIYAGYFKEVDRVDA
jgi:ABC-2 type transport system ATP-binding protein